MARQNHCFDPGFGPVVLLGRGLGLTEGSFVAYTFITVTKLQIWCYQVLPRVFVKHNMLYTITVEKIPVMAERNTSFLLIK